MSIYLNTPSMPLDCKKPSFKEDLLSLKKELISLNETPLALNSVPLKDEQEETDALVPFMPLAQENAHYANLRQETRFNVNDPFQKTIFELGNELFAFISRLEKENAELKQAQSAIEKDKKELVRLVEATLSGIIKNLNERFEKIYKTFPKELKRSLQSGKSELTLNELLIKLKQVQKIDDELNSWELWNGEFCDWECIEDSKLEHLITKEEINLKEKGIETDLERFIRDLEVINRESAQYIDEQFQVPYDPSATIKTLKNLLVIVQFSGKGVANTFWLAAIIYKEALRIGTFFSVAAVVLQSPWTPVLQTLVGLLVPVIKKVLS